jgi:pantoate kinase
VSLGVRATVDAESTDIPEILPMEGGRIPPVMASALGGYLERSPGPVTVRVGLELDLPVGQGFGMSGAMTFAALMAAEAELGLACGDLDVLTAHAHVAEVTNRTGLGDVVAQAGGGIDLRRRPGLPPVGEVVHRRQDAELLLAWGRIPLHTRSVLADPMARQRLEAACLPRLEALEEEPELDWLLDAGRGFSEEAGLMSEDVRVMMNICSAHGKASQVMLGNSIFATGDLKAMGHALGEARFDWVIVSIDNEGVRRAD